MLRVPGARYASSAVMCMYFEYICIVYIYIKTLLKHIYIPGIYCPNRVPANR